MKEFDLGISKWVPFREKKIIERVKNIKREDIEKHNNKDFRIRVVKNDEIEFLWILDLFYRIQEASKNSKKIIILLPNPSLIYKKVALLINKFKVSCKNLYIFILDEYADQNGNVVSESYPQSFLRSVKMNFIYNIDKKLRPPEKQIIGPTTKNIKYYGRILKDMGNADICYTGPGWTGHIAFIEPDSEEFGIDELEEWMKLSSRIVTLSPFTIAQNSLHSNFGLSGDLSAVPPKAATIGPAEIIEAKNRMDLHYFTIGSTNISWQRFISRLSLHGPVTPKVPTSILQLLRTDVLVSESIAEDIKIYKDIGY